MIGEVHSVNTNLRKLDSSNVPDRQVRDRPNEKRTFEPTFSTASQERPPKSADLRERLSLSAAMAIAKSSDVATSHKLTSWLPVEHFATGHRFDGRVTEISKIGEVFVQKAKNMEKMSKLLNDHYNSLTEDSSHIDENAICVAR